MKSSLNDFETLQPHRKGTRLIERILSSDAALILLAIILVLVLISLSGCTPAAASVPTATPAPTTAPTSTDDGLPAIPPGKPLLQTPTAGENAIDASAPIVAVAEKALAAKLGIAAGGITFVSGEYVEWSDSCLGVTHAGEMCAQVITPGYRVILAVSGAHYEVHTDLSGKSVRIK